MLPTNMVPMTAQSRRMPSRMRTAGTSRATRVPVAQKAAGTVLRHAVSTRAKLRPRPALPPHRGLELMFEAQVEVRFGRHGGVHAALAGLRTNSAWRPRGFRSVPFNENRVSNAFLADAARKRAGPALMRLANGQQNAHRRDPSGGNPGG